MADAIKNLTSVFIEEEVTEGTYVAPSAATSAISPMEDGVNDLIIPAKEILERENLNASLDNAASRTGIKSANGTIAIELKSGDSGAPETGILYESALGTTSAASADLATSTTHTTSLINMASTTGLAVGDIVAIKNAGGDIIHVSPIASLITDTSITLLVADSAAFADTVTVTKMIDYKTTDSGHPSFSITKYTTSNDSDHVEEYAAGCKVASMSIENFSTGQMPSVSFGYEGLSFSRSVANPTYSPTLDSSLPVIALGACIYQDGTAITVNELSVSLENTLGFKTSTCDSNGRTGSRVTSRAITGSFTPYKQDDSIADYTKWLADTTFSLFFYAYNPDSSDNMTEVFACYIPNCQFTEIGQSDLDGLLQNSLTFAARTPASLDTMKIAFA